MPSRVPAHRPARLPGPSRHREYDRHGRDREAKVFYDSARWRMLRRLKLRRDPLCERCRESGRIVPATVVHHRVERRAEPELELELTNLESLCAPCHGRHHASGMHATS